MSIYLSILLNILLVAAFIIDRVFRLRSIKDYKEAKEAQVANLQTQLNSERKIMMCRSLKCIKSVMKTSKWCSTKTS